MTPTRTITVEVLAAALHRMGRFCYSSDGDRCEASVHRIPTEPTAHESMAAAIFAALPAEPAGAGLREARPKPTCGTEPPFDPDGCAHDHHGWLVCGELVGSSGGQMPEPVYCEHIDRRYALWLERAARAALAAHPNSGQGEER